MTDADPPLFRDHERPIAERVGDLIGRLTVAEKISLLHQDQPGRAGQHLEPRVVAGPSAVRLRADDPRDGPVLATLTAEVVADRYA